jgi:hypothetical protein
MSDRDLLPAALNAIHEAFGTPVTRCAQLNRVIREYPDGATDENMRVFLADHDAGRCECAKPNRHDFKNGDG